MVEPSLLKSNLSVVHMLASVRLSGITVALTDWHDAFSVLSPVSRTQQHCLLIPVYDSKASYCSHTVVINCSVLADISVYCNVRTAVNEHTHSRDMCHRDRH